MRTNFHGLLLAATLLVGCGAVALVASSVGCNRESQAAIHAGGPAVARMRLADPASRTGEGHAAITGWGTLKGRFTYDGIPPAPTDNPAFNARKDPLCRIGRLHDERLLVDSSKGIANILIFLTEAPAVHPDILAAPPKEVVFDQMHCRFLDHVSGVYMKDKWVILNSDETGHSASFSPLGSPPASPLLALRTGRFEFPGFKKPLVKPFEVTCGIHPWMKAFVIPRPDPYFAVTAADGSFTIPNLPAGVDLEFQVWHELAPEGLKAKPQWNRGRVKLKIPNDGDVVTLDVPVDPALLPK